MTSRHATSYPVLLREEGDVGEGLVCAAADRSQPRGQAPVDQLSHVGVTLLP